MTGRDGSTGIQKREVIILSPGRNNPRHCTPGDAPNLAGQSPGHPAQTMDEQKLHQKISRDPFLPQVFLRTDRRLLPK